MRLLQVLKASNYFGMCIWRTGCVWTTYLANGELQMFPRDGLEGDREIEKLQLLR